MSNNRELGMAKFITRQRLELKKVLFMIFPFLLLLSIGCAHYGQRLLTYEIDVNGQVVYQGIRGVPDNMPVEKMWKILEEVEFEPTPNQTPTTPLPGVVVVRIKHVNNELAKRSLPSAAIKTQPNGMLRVDMQSLSQQ